MDVLFHNETTIPYGRKNANRGNLPRKAASGTVLCASHLTYESDEAPWGRTVEIPPALVESRIVEV